MARPPSDPNDPSAWLGDGAPSAEDIASLAAELLWAPPGTGAITPAKEHQPDTEEAISPQKQPGLEGGGAVPAERKPAARGASASKPPAKAQAPQGAFTPGQGSQPFPQLRAMREAIVGVSASEPCLLDALAPHDDSIEQALLASIGYTMQPPEVMPSGGADAPVRSAPSLPGGGMPSGTMPTFGATPAMSPSGPQFGGGAPISPELPWSQAAPAFSGMSFSGTDPSSYSGASNLAPHTATTPEQAWDPFAIASAGNLKPEAGSRLPATDRFGLGGGTPASPRIADDTLELSFLKETQGASTSRSGQKDEYDKSGVRADFPALHQHVNGKPLIWLDNAATTQKPQHVIDAVSRFYERDNSNIHRAAHTLAARATDAFEEARQKVQRFLGAATTREIVFVRGTTEAINLVAQSWGRKFIGPGDEIVLTRAEHHSNIVPWQMLAKEKGATIKVAPIDDRGELVLEEYERLLGPKVKLVSFTHVSNALGTVMPVTLMTQMAHRYGARVLVDGAQSTPHFPVNVQQIGCDWYVMSGHKLFAPTGIGALYGREEVLREMPPWQGGGNMIEDVTFERTKYADIPAKFEAGTGILAGAVGLGAAIDYLDQIGFAAASQYEHGLLHYGTELLLEIKGVRLIGTAAEKAGVLSFVLDGIRTQDMGAFLDREGIAVRTGHHCAQPALRHFGLEATVRASLAFYNTRAELDALAKAVRKALGELR